MPEGNGEIGSIYNPVFEAKLEAKRDVRDGKEVDEFLKEKGKEAGEGNPTLQQFIDQFQDVMGGAAFVVQDEQTGNWYTYGAITETEPGSSEKIKNLPDTTFRIRDSAKFIAKVAEFEDVLGIVGKTEAREADGQVGVRVYVRDVRNRWVSGQNGTRVWANATPYDMQNPERFMDREIAMIKDETFTDLVDWRPVCDSTVLGERLFVRRTTPASEYESPNDLRIAFGNGERPGNLDDLPAVRYGRVAPDTMVIYAVQMPSTGNMTEKVLEGRLEQAEKKARISMEYFKEQHKNNNRALVQTIGRVSKSIWSVTDPEQFSLALYGYLMDRCRKDGYEDLNKWAYDHRYKGSSSILDKLLRRTSDQANDLQLLHDRLVPLEEAILIFQQKKEMEEQLKGYEQRSARLERVNDPMRGNFSTEKLYEGLRGAPPAKVISVAVALKMFEMEGITKIEMPLYLPFRRHYITDPQLSSPVREGDDVLDAKIFREKVITLQRVCHEVKGLKITETPTPADADGYLHIEIKGRLTSDRPLFKEIFQALEERPIHSKQTEVPLKTE